jgi:hypothetical protein
MTGMNSLTAALGSTALACLAASFQEGHGHAGAGGQGGHGKQADAKDLRATFEGHCGRCHVAPDPAFAVDRAWLEQVHDTA